MQARMRDRHLFPTPRLRWLLPPVLAVLALAAATVLLRPVATPTGRDRAILVGQLRAFADWERAHPHACLVPLVDGPAGGNDGYQRRADWFLEGQGAAALQQYRAWFRQTYAAEHPDGR